MKRKFGGECQICDGIPNNALVKRKVQMLTDHNNKSVWLKMEVWCCTKCAAKLHFGTLSGVKLCIPKPPVIVEGTVFQYKKGMED